MSGEENRRLSAFAAGSERRASRRNTNVSIHEPVTQTKRPSVRLSTPFLTSAPHRTPLQQDPMGHRASIKPTSAASGVGFVMQPDSRRQSLEVSSNARRPSAVHRASIAQPSVRRASIVSFRQSTQTTGTQSRYSANCSPFRLTLLTSLLPRLPDYSRYIYAFMVIILVLITFCVFLISLSFYHTRVKAHQTHT